MPGSPQHRSGSPREIGFQLILHGYLATRSALDGKSEAVVGEHLVTMLEMSGNACTDLAKSVHDVAREAAEMRRGFIDFSYVSHLGRTAGRAWKAKLFADPARRYEEFMIASAAIDGGACTLGTFHYIRYADCLAKTGDPRSEFAARLAERRLSGGHGDPDSGLLLAAVHADRRDGGSVVRCLREWQMRASRGNARLLLRNGTAFRAVAELPEVQTFLNEPEDPTEPGPSDD